MDKLQLKKRLIELMKNDWSFPDDMNGDAFADELKDALTSTDSTLRDRLAYIAFYKLVSGGKVSDEKCRTLYFELIGDKYLQLGLGLEHDDSVFGRAFLVYAAEEFISYNRAVDRRLFTDEEVCNFLDIVLKVFIRERDLRGWDVEKGWAHAVAHTGDVLGGIALDPAIGRDGLMAILNAIRDKVCIDHFRWTAGEEGRLAYAVQSVLSREEISESEFAQWIASFAEIKADDPIRTRCLRLNRNEFFWHMYRTLKDSSPALHKYVWDACESAVKQFIGIAETGGFGNRDRGLIHCIADTGNVLGNLAKTADHAGLLSILDMVRSRVYMDYCADTNMNEIYYLPDDVVLKVLERGLVSEEEFVEWIKSFQKCEHANDPATEARMRLTRSEFAGTLAWRLSEKYPKLRKHVLDVRTALWEMECDMTTEELTNN